MKNVSEASHGLDRAMMLIEFMSLHPQGMSLSEISRQTGLAKSSVHRLLNEFVFLGYMQQSENKDYSLSFKFCEISSRILSSKDIVLISVPYIRDLCQRVGEVVHLVVRSDTNIVYLRKEEPFGNTLQAMSCPGMMRPMYATSAGKSILSRLSDEEISGIWQCSDVKPITPNTITELPQLLSELHTARQNGYALDDEENEPGIRCLGAPILDFHGTPIGAVSVSAPLQRMTGERIVSLAPLVVETAQSISAQMGSTSV